MSADLTIGGMDELARFAAMVSRAGYFGVKPEQAAIKILAGRELGIGPIQAMMNVHVIKDKHGTHRITLAAGLVGALIRKSGSYDYHVLKSAPDKCSIRFDRIIGENRVIELGIASFTMDDARQAGLADKHNWRTYPQDMLFARALTRGARRFTPDVFGGPIYTTEEITGDEAGVPDMEVPHAEPTLGGEHDQDPVRDELLEDLVHLRAGNAHLVDWLHTSIAEDPIGGNSWFGPETVWLDGATDDKAAKAVRQRFHIWTKEAGNAYDDVRHWPLYAIKAQGIINLNRALRERVREDNDATETEPDTQGAQGPGTAEPEPHGGDERHTEAGDESQRSGRDRGSAGMAAQDAEVAEE